VRRFWLRELPAVRRSVDVAVPMKKGMRGCQMRRGDPSVERVNLGLRFSFLVTTHDADNRN
jgi:hypothetical protein